MLSMQVCACACPCMCTLCTYGLSYICILDDVPSVCVCFISISVSEPVDYFFGAWYGYCANTILCSLLQVVVTTMPTCRLVRCDQH